MAVALNYSAQASTVRPLETFWPMPGSPSTPVRLTDDDAIIVERTGNEEKRLAELEAQVAQIREEMEAEPKVCNAQILDLGDSRYTLKFPLLVTLEIYDEEVVASLPDLDLYASGVSEAIALQELKAEIVATYARLLELTPEQLGPLPQAWLAALSKAIEIANA